MSVDVFAGQLAVEQLVPSRYFWQPPRPSHLPFWPQLAWPWSAQNVAGAAVPAATGAHVPVPDRLHALQGPHEAEPQHTPSTQLPLMHWAPAVHTRPFFLSAQLCAPAVPWHVKGATQSPSPVHVVLHAVEPQTYGEQLAGVGVAHEPVPVQFEMGVDIEPEHEGLPQLTLAAASSHAPAPLQLPVLPQGGAAGQRACGSASPEPTAAHEPALPVMLHAWHRPHVEAPQHTPSTQKLPVRQSEVAAHVWPRRFLLPHRFVFGSQMLGARQSPSVVHAALQAAVPLHMKGAHAIVDAAWQLPTPSHERACVSVAPAAGHDGATHSVPGAKKRHEPLPSQRPSVPQLAAPWFLHVPCGSVEPLPTFVHTPIVPGSAQDSQEPLQVELQHTPCAQNFDRHSPLPAQLWPMPLRPHEPLMHTAGDAQSASAAHAPLQTAAPHL